MALFWLFAGCLWCQHSASGQELHHPCRSCGQQCNSTWVGCFEAAGGAILGPQGEYLYSSTWVSCPASRPYLLAQFAGHVTLVFVLQLAAYSLILGLVGIAVRVANRLLISKTHCRLPIHLPEACQIQASSPHQGFCTSCDLTNEVCLHRLAYCVKQKQ